MTANSHRESATIYMFPKGGRVASAESIRKARFAAELAALQLTETVCGDNWYHDEAIQAADPTSRH